jgi:uncharacterized protein (DUF302 family)
MRPGADRSGLIHLESKWSVAQTTDRLETLLKAKGFKIFARIDQKLEAEAVGLTMRPMQLVIFGDPRAGTPLMNTHPTIGIDLPLKVMVWEDGDGRVWLSYTDPVYLQERHGLKETPFKAIGALVEQVFA